MKLLSKKAKKTLSCYGPVEWVRTGKIYGCPPY
jgi:hypothetical protein